MKARLQLNQSKLKDKHFCKALKPPPALTGTEPTPRTRLQPTAMTAGTLPSPARPQPSGSVVRAPPGPSGGSPAATLPPAGTQKQSGQAKPAASQLVSRCHQDASGNVLGTGLDPALASAPSQPSPPTWGRTAPVKPHHREATTASG